MSGLASVQFKKLKPVFKLSGAVREKGIAPFPIGEEVKMLARIKTATGETIEVPIFGGIVGSQGSRLNKPQLIL